MTTHRNQSLNFSPANKTNENSSFYEPTNYKRLKTKHLCGQQTTCKVSILRDKTTHTNWYLNFSTDNKTTKMLNFINTQTVSD